MNSKNLKSFLSLFISLLLMSSTFGFAPNAPATDRCMCCCSGIEKSDCCCSDKHKDQNTAKNKPLCRCAAQPADTNPFLIETPSVRIVVYPASIGELQFLWADSRNDFLCNFSFHSPPVYHFSGHSLPLLI
jgi:hypothetical protein